MCFLRRLSVRLKTNGTVQDEGGLDGPEPRKVATRSNRRTASSYRPHVYDFHDADVVLLEGIFIYKRAYRPHFDLACWIDCTFETALERALRRAQEGLPPGETIEAYRTIYFPAQRLHEKRDRPREGADEIIVNDPRL
jgi:uridine kinase